MQKEEPYFERFPVREYIEALLGDLDCVPIKKQWAEVIEIKIKGTLYWHIEWPDKWNNITGPLLWVYPKWVESSERRERARKRSEEERNQRFVDEANIKIVAYKVAEFLMIDTNRATSIAFSFVRNKQIGKIKAVGVHKLIEKVEDIP